jgi:hypothetical protein
MPNFKYLVGIAAFFEQRSQQASQSTVPGSLAALG